MPTTRADIRDFLAQRRIAMIGVSRDPKDFSRMLFREMSGRGYDMVPVNPAAAEMEGRPCFAGVEQIQPTPEAALLMTAASATPQAVRECASAGIRRIWMYRAAGQGAVNPEAVAYCRENGMQLVEGHCPYMFLPKTQFFHRLHGFALRVFGGYPPECDKRAA
jgi:predicted CoA-binding protein